VIVKFDDEESLSLSMWFVYRFRRNTEASVPPARAINHDIAAFSDAIVRQVGQQARWVAPTARAPDGGIEVWYNLPQLPSEPPLREAWANCLSTYALVGRRITNR
jgi:hypothetical protein